MRSTFLPPAVTNLRASIRLRKCEAVFLSFTETEARASLTRSAQYAPWTLAAYSVHLLVAWRSVLGCSVNHGDIRDTADEARPARSYTSGLRMVGFCCV